MAEILTTKQFAAALETIIRKAEREVFLVSYSFKIDDTYINRIKEASERNVKIKIIYGEQINNETLKELRNISNVEILQLNNLHAKVFANESECIVGSMNLYSYSEHHNTELGCLITAKNDVSAFNDALAHCKYIYKLAKGVPDKIHNNNTGFCIRTGKQIPFNIEKPLSYEVWKVWSKYSNGNKDIKEHYCHFSGERSNGETTINKPILKKNWKKAKETHGL